MKAFENYSQQNTDLTADIIKAVSMKYKNTKSTYIMKSIDVVQRLCTDYYGLHSGDICKTLNIISLNLLTHTHKRNKSIHLIFKSKSQKPLTLTYQLLLHPKNYKMYSNLKFEVVVPKITQMCNEKGFSEIYVVKRCTNQDFETEIGHFFINSCHWLQIKW